MENIFTIAALWLGLAVISAVDDKISQPFAATINRHAKQRQSS